MKTSLSNILFYWPQDKVYDFYDRVMKTTVDIVYLGESVCSKRRSLKLEDWIEIGKNIEQSGKQVVLSSLALLEAKSELSQLKKLCDNGQFLVEANDFGAIHFLQQNKLPFVAGNALNIYNQHDLSYLYNKGMKRWVVPVELSKQWIMDIKNQLTEFKLEDAFEIEITGYGYLPLAYAARCFTARSEKRAKDQCDLCCINYPQGRSIKSQEQDQLFTMNGIQTLSGLRQNLINDLNDVRSIANVVRIIPDEIASLDWIDKFSSSNDFHIDMRNYCNGFWHKIEGMKAVE